jgi:hypothetical protein
VIEAIDAGATGAGPPCRPESPVEALARLQAGADAGLRGHGAGPVGLILAGVAAARADDHDEFRSALPVELTRRYLRAVHRHARGDGPPRVWQVVLARWEAAADPARTALAGAHALVGYDLAPAVVTTCTLLGRSPGRAERTAVLTLAGRIAALAAGSRLADTPGLLLAGGEAWRQAEHLWSVRGRPSVAERERIALDWRTALVARTLLGG